MKRNRRIERRMRDTMDQIFASKVQYFLADGVKDDEYFKRLILAELENAGISKELRLLQSCASKMRAQRNLERLRGCL